MKLLLDTNAYAALLRGHSRAAAEVRSAQMVLMSAVVVGELLYGFRAGSRFADNLRELDRFLQNPYVELLAVTRMTADRFGTIAAALRRKGTPIPTNDVWIAAHALESGAALVSFDRHFEAIDGLLQIDPGPDG